MPFHPTGGLTDAKIGTHQHIDMVYICRPLSTDLVHQPDEVSGCTWVPIDDVRALDTPPELPSLITTATKYVRSSC